MHLPGKRIYEELRAEEAGIWFVPANFGEEIAVLIKAPSTVLKALLSGCPLGFAFGLRDNYLCRGAHVYDVADAPVFICDVQRHLEEHVSLRRFLIEKQAPLFLFNELDVCVAWSTALVSEDSSKSVINLLSAIEDRYVGDFTPEMSLALDDFCFSIDSTQRFDDTHEIPTIEIAIQHGPWTSNTVSYAGNLDSQKIILDDSEEGAVLEKTVWATLESVFPFDLHRSPCVQVGNKTRELIDVLTSYRYGSFFIEAKDLSIFGTGLDRSRERRTKSVQKQTKKAITQLVGASKAAKRNEKIFDSSGNDIRVIREKPFHCIVLLTELMHEGDWADIVKQLREAIFVTGDFFHILDLQELVMLLKISKGRPELLDYNLMERCKRFIEKETVHIRSR